MKAVVNERYGTPDVLEVREVARPVPKDDEVLVRVHAVSLNDWDWGVLTGVPREYRLFSGLFRPKVTILGSDVAGVVEAAGKKVKKFKSGDEVYGDLSDNGGWGGFAEYVCAKEDLLAAKPADMSFEQAAALPQAGMLAVQGLLDHGKIRAGDKVLINGAGGGVGTIGVQIAKTFDVEVTGVDSAGKLDTMRSAGFDHVIDYTKEDFTRTGKRYDLILDTKTSRSVFAHARALNPGGRYVTVGGESGRIIQLVLLGGLVQRLSGKKMSLVMLKQNKDLAYLNELFLSGKLKPVIGGIYGLEELPQAFTVFGEGRHKGKLVIKVRQ